MAENEIAEITEEIKPLAKEYKALKKRLTEMAIFRDRESEGGKSRKKSAVLLHSSPEEELFYEHRRLYERVEDEKAKLQEQVSGMRPTGDDDVKDFRAIQRTLYAMGSAGEEHLEQMRKILSDLRDRLKDIENKMIAITQERSRLVNSMLQHKDKMELARDGAREPTTTELVERLAAKHGVPVSEVEELLRAKTVDVNL